MLYILPSCRHSFSHPPVFSEAVECYNYNKKCDEFETSKQYDIKDLNQVFNTNDFRFHLSVGIQLSQEDNLLVLWKTAQKFNDQPSVLFAFINAYYTLNLYKSHDNYLNGKMAKASLPGFIDISLIINRLKKIDPDNSLPYYLEAYYLAIRDKKKAVKSLALAEKKTKFSIYDTEIMNYSILTSEFLGYPRFLSMDVGLSTVVSAVAPPYFVKLAKLAIKFNDGSLSHYIYTLGKRLEDNSFMLLVKNFGISIQMIALAADGKDITVLEKRSKYNFKIFSKFDMKNITENEDKFVEFYQFMIENDEIKAMEKFMGN